MRSEHLRVPDVCAAVRPDVAGRRSLQDTPTWCDGASTHLVSSSPSWKRTKVVRKLMQTSTKNIKSTHVSQTIQPPSAGMLNPRR